MDFRLTAVNCTDTTLGMISWMGSDITVRDSILRVCGIVMEGGDPQSLSGIVNGTQYEDFIFSLTDRTLRMIDTQVKTWNMYAFNDQELEFENCLLGEVHAYGESEVLMTHCVIDGTGGYLGVTEQASLNFQFSSATCQVLATDQSELIYVYSGHLFGRFLLTDNSHALLFNASLLRGVEPVDSAVVFDSAITHPVSPAPVNCDLPVMGTARVLTGPDISFLMEAYWLDYGEGYEPETWHPVGGRHEYEVHKGLLETWDTSGLVPGPYQLRLTIELESGDAFSIVNPVELAAIPTYTNTPSPTPGPTTTPTPGYPFGVRLDMPTFVSPGEDFWITAYLDNPGQPRNDVPLFLFLEAFESYWFWPGWTHYSPPNTSGIDYDMIYLPAGTSSVEALSLIQWPDTGDESVTGLFFYGAMLTQDMTAIEGEWSVVAWGYGPQDT